MNNYCQKHPDEKLTLFCDHCECLTCRDCAIVTCRGHSCNFITDVEAEFREEFADKIDRSEEKLMNLTGKFYEPYGTKHRRKTDVSCTSGPRIFDSMTVRCHDSGLAQVLGSTV